MGVIKRFASEDYVKTELEKIDLFAFKEVIQFLLTLRLL